MTDKLAKRFKQAEKVAPNRCRKDFLTILYRKVIIGTVTESEAFAILG